MAKSPLALDERNVETVRKVCTVMYGVTMVLLSLTIFYRQFVLGQATGEFEDIAVILTLNVIVGLGALLYFGGVALPQISPRALASGYLGFVLLGFGFTVFKYTVLLDQPMDAGALWASFLTVATVCALLTGLYILAAYLGHRRLEKEAR
jgi:hypothetical protein